MADSVRLRLAMFPEKNAGPCWGLEMLIESLHHGVNDSLARMLEACCVGSPGGLRAPGSSGSGPIRATRRHWR